MNGEGTTTDERLCRRCREYFEELLGVHYCEECYDYIRKVRYFEVTPECMLDLLAKTHRITVEGMPEDCEFVDIHYDRPRRVFMVYVRHPEFSIVPEGGCMQRIDTIIHFMED